MCRKVIERCVLMNTSDITSGFQADGSLTMTLCQPDGLAARNLFACTDPTRANCIAPAGPSGHPSVDPAPSRLIGVAPLGRTQLSPDCEELDLDHSETHNMKSEVHTTDVTKAAAHRQDDQCPTSNVNTYPHRRTRERTT